MSIQATAARRSRPPGVEAGVTGAERRFQQNRQFGPGAFTPYGPGHEAPNERDQSTRPSTRRYFPTTVPQNQGERNAGPNVKGQPRARGRRA